MKLWLKLYRVAAPINGEGVALDGGGFTGTTSPGDVSGSNVEIASPRSEGSVRATKELGGDPRSLNSYVPFMGGRPLRAKRRRWKSFDVLKKSCRKNMRKIFKNIYVFCLTWSRRLLYRCNMGMRD